MVTTPSLEDLIRNKDIEFFSFGRKLDADIENFGSFNWDLVKHVVNQSGNNLVIKGKPLQDYLTNKNNLFGFANYLVQFYFEGAGRAGKTSFAIHVDTDIETLNQHYPQPAEEKLVNGLGQVVVDAASWVPEMPYFEKLWNFALDLAVGGAVGYPGYEHPRNDASFRCRIGELAENYMVGTRQQIQRYKKYALESLGKVTKIAGELKDDPESIFDDYYKLRGLEMVSCHTRIIAENIAYFSTDYDKGTG